MDNKDEKKKAKSLQQNPAVIMSWTLAVALSEHTAVTAQTCRIADSKVAADNTYGVNLIREKDRI